MRLLTSSTIPLINSTFISYILPILSSAKYLCVWPCSDSLLDSFFLSLKSQKFEIPYSVITTGPIPSNCFHLHFLNCPIDEIALIVSKINDLSWKYKIVIIDDNPRFDPEQINGYRSIFKSATVVFNFGNEIRVLSSPLDTPRFITESSNLELVENVTDLQARKIPVINIPWMYYKYFKERFSDGKEVVMTFFNDLALQLNFTWDVYIPDSCNKSLEQCILDQNTDELLNRALAEGQIEVDYEGSYLRKNYVGQREYGPVTSDAVDTHLVRRPTMSHARLYKVTKLLSPILWLCIFLSFVCTSFFYWMAKLRQCSFGDAVLHTTQVLLLTGESPPRSAAGLIMVKWSFFAITITTFFTGNLLDFLSRSEFTPRIDTMEQLEEGGFRPANFCDFLKNNLTKEEILKQVLGDKKLYFNASQFDKWVVPSKEGLLIGDALRQYRAMALKEGERFRTYVFVKGSPLYPILTKGIQRLFETGLFNFYKIKYQQNMPAAIRHLVIEEDKPIITLNYSTIKDFRILFAILAFGIAISMVVLLSEIVYFKFTQRNMAAKLGPSTSLLLADKT